MIKKQKKKVIKLPTLSRINGDYELENTSDIDRSPTWIDSDILASK